MASSVGNLEEGDHFNGQPGLSSVDVVALPWVFTQHHPLDADEFVRRAKERGVDLDALKLRQLYKRRILTPFVALTTHPHNEPRFPEASEPQRAGTRLYQLREARRTGHLLDLSAEPYFPRLRFTQQRPYKPGWWSGLLYSHHQLTLLPRLNGLLSQCRYSVRDKRLYPRLPEPDPFLRHRANRYHRIALMATALEARYLPVLDPDWIYLVNAEPSEYEQYRENFDPIVMRDYLRYPPEQVRKDAEDLLLLVHSIEPMSGPWSQLLRRAPRDSWKHLKGAALSAMDLRETAEILLRFYEDLVTRDAAEPLPSAPRLAWQPLVERLSYRRETLDKDLMQIGISPHHRVVLAVEGETEERHAPLVLERVGPRDAHELIRIMTLRGVDNSPVKAGALAATPIVTRKSEDGQFWWIMKPPTRFVVAADPEGKYYAPDKIGNTRKLILDDIKSNLKAKGATAADEDLEELVELCTWDASCYEYAHFSDHELADAIAKVHTTCNGYTRDQLLNALSHWRWHKKDVDRVWLSGGWDWGLNRPKGKWVYGVSKTKLADVLWPILEQKIDAALSDTELPMPPIAAVIENAITVAQGWRYKSFVLRAAE